MKRCRLSFVWIFLTGCALSPSANLLDVAKTSKNATIAGTYDYWVASIGKVKTDQLVAGLGLSVLNSISISIGYTNMITLMNSLTDVSKFIGLNNQVANQDNLSALLLAVADPRNTSSPSVFSAFLNDIPTPEISRFVSFLRMLAAPVTSSGNIYPSVDYVLLAQLMANYNGANITTSSGVGTGIMNTLFGNLALSNGQGYVSAPTITSGALNAAGGTGATAAATISAGSVTKVTISSPGVGCTSISTVSLSGGGGSGAVLGMTVVPEAGNNTNVVLDSLYITAAGSGYASAPAVSFTGSCSSLPAATTSVSGISGWTVVTAGSAYTNSFPLAAGNITGGSGSGASGTVLVAGPINTGGSGLSSFYGGAGYTTGQVCPINGASGSGATCTVTAPGGVISGCSAMTAGSGYIGGQIVSIGGAATAYGTVDSVGKLTAVNMISSGCGYGAAPTVTVLTGAYECATAGSYTATVASGRVTGIATVTAATGCPANPTIVIGETPYAAHGDGATAIVSAVSGGKVIGISMSAPTENFSQLLTNLDKSPRSKAVNYNGAATNISAREALVRFIYHGVNHQSSGYTPFFGIDNVNYPGIGPGPMAQWVLAGGGGPIVNTVNNLNGDTTNMTDIVTLIGCGDHIQYAIPASLPVMTVNDFHWFCFNHSPTLW